MPTSNINYTTLVASSSTAGSIANWINSSTIAASAPTIVNEFESAVYRRLRVWQMLVPPVTGTLTIGQDYLALPNDFLDMKDHFLTGIYQQKLVMKTEEEVIWSYSYDGTGARVQQQPNIFFINRDNISYDNPPDQAYGYLLTYYQQPASLSVSLTNFLTAFYPRLVRVGCMAAAAEFMKDSGQGNYDRTYWDEMFEAEIEKAQIESDRSRRATEAGAVFIGGGGGGLPSYGVGF